MSSSSASNTEEADEEDMSYLEDPQARDEKYGKNIAKYLMDLHDAEATFNFCGGMMFQLVLTKELYSQLSKISSSSSSSSQKQPVIFPSDNPRMHNIPNYSQDANADNIYVFHGREIRNVKHAKGGMGFVLQLSSSATTTTDSATRERDPEGWTPQEINGYDGWKHDVSRTWRNSERLEEEGVQNFKKDFGEDCITLNHRFYLHYDQGGSMWLAAEDGCEGTPQLKASSAPRNRGIFSFF